MTVYITAIGALCGDQLDEFNPRKDLPNRKHLKMMTRDVRLGVGAVAWTGCFGGHDANLLLVAISSPAHAAAAFWEKPERAEVVPPEQQHQARELRTRREESAEPPRAVRADLVPLQVQRQRLQSRPRAEPCTEALCAHSPHSVAAQVEADLPEL